MLRRGIAALLVLAAIVVAVYAALVWNNNRDVSPVARSELDTRWENGVQWLVGNREMILRDQNPALWWMVGESARLSGDERLRSLFEEFLARYDSRSVWMVFFEPTHFRNVVFPPELYRSFADYQQYFLFTLSCNRQMALDPSVAGQHETGFCWRKHPLSPACVTHQLMGFRFAQRIECSEVEGLPEKVTALQQQVAAQLTWDPRVVDVYIQRVLMLEESGGGALIKPRWMQRALAAQLEDGSWSQLQPLLPLGGKRYFGFDARLIGVGEVRGDFHASAQGVWLLSLLRSK